MATTRITRLELICENLVDGWTKDAAASGKAAFIARAVATAPLSYAEMRELNARQALAARLAQLDVHALRLQVIRFLVERAEATGAAWGWGDVDATQAVFARLVEAWRAEQRALVQVEIASAVQDEAYEFAESSEEYAEAVELHGIKADVYFERRAAREVLERALLIFSAALADSPPPADDRGRISKAEIRARMRDHKRADIAARRQLAPRSGRRAVRGW